MPEGSHSALHQGPMGEGKTSALIFSLTYALVIAVYESTSFMIWRLFIPTGISGYARQCANITQQYSRGEWKNAGNGRTEEM